MSTLPQPEALAQSADWQSVLTHFDYHEGFAFGLLLVAGNNLSEACRADLERHLALSGKLLLDLSPKSPGELLPRCLGLTRQAIGPEVGCIWISAVVSEYQSDFAEWNAAFQDAFARLNPVRNVLQHHLTCTILFVGAPWVQSAIRSVAPDLWSVRSLVTTVTGAALPSDSVFPSFAVAPGAVESPDPEFALSEADGLRGKAGQETALIRLLDRAGDGFLARFRFDEAAKALRESLELRRGMGLPPIEVARAEIALANSLIEPGHYAAGIPHVEAALELLGDGNVDSNPAQLDAMSDVATLLGRVGRLDAATELSERIVPAAQVILGGEDPRTLLYMKNLGVMLSRRGDLERARSMLEDVVNLSRRLLGPEHFSTLKAMNNLAATLWRQDNFAGARAIQEHILEVNRRLLGWDHPDTLVVMNNLAASLASMGDIAGALALEEQVLSRLIKSVGPDNPNALTAGYNIAGWRARKGDLAGAREQFEKVLEARDRLFGNSHPDTLHTMQALAGIDERLGQTAEAEDRRET